MMTLEQIRQRNKAENAAAQRLQAAGYRLEGWDPRTGQRARVPLAPFQGGTVSPPDDPAKCRRAKGSDSSLNGISPHR